MFKGQRGLDSIPDYRLAMDMELLAGPWRLCLKSLKGLLPCAAIVIRNTIRIRHVPLYYLCLLFKIECIERLS